MQSGNEKKDWEVWPCLHSGVNSQGDPVVTNMACSKCLKERDQKNRQEDIRILKRDRAKMNTEDWTPEFRHGVDRCIWKLEEELKNEKEVGENGN